VSGTITLIYSAATQKWHGSGAVGTCGFTIDLAFYCVGGGSACGDFRLDADLSCQPAELGIVPDGGCSCNPLDVFFVVGSSTCCGVPVSTITVTVTL
jgi:hypothetical protein